MAVNHGTTESLSIICRCIGRARSIVETMKKLVKTNRIGFELLLWMNDEEPPGPDASALEKSLINTSESMHNA